MHQAVAELRHLKNKQDLNKLKLALSKEKKLSRLPKTIELLCSLKGNEIRSLKSILLSKPVRTISGVAPIAIMTKPFPCPAQAQCIYCPGGPNSAYGDTPKSYPGGSPCHLRAERNNYDPYLQVFNRLEHYVLLNQDCSKTELIIMGGTFPAYPRDYREEFAACALKAMNDFSDMFFKNDKLDFKKFFSFFELPSDVKNNERLERVKSRLLKQKGKNNLEKEQLRNESSKIRCVTFCVETRSDCSKTFHIDDMLRLGTTRVEVGIQSIYDDVLSKIRRGNTNSDNVVSTQLLKDSLLKVGYHIMLGLPGSSIERDKQMFKELFANQSYMPDALKIYPCMVFKGTKLYDLWKSKGFSPITANEAAPLIAEAKLHVPEWCRIMRVQRDIPTSLVEAGVEKTNLRQYVHEIMKKNSWKCRCIRCREPKDAIVDWDNVRMKRANYVASNSDEIFLSFEDVKNDLLLGFLRLRKPCEPYRPEITENSMGIREIHVYGTAVQIGKDSKKEIQHKGIGSLLMNEAERIASEEYKADKLLIISGIGVREYFNKKFGYKKDGPYMSKKI